MSRRHCHLPPRWLRGIPLAYYHSYIISFPWPWWFQRHGVILTVLCFACHGTEFIGWIYESFGHKQSLGNVAFQPGHGWALNCGSGWSILCWTNHDRNLNMQKYHAPWCFITGQVRRLNPPLRAVKLWRIRCLLYFTVQYSTIQYCT